jgi:hypothetical protein
MRCDSNSQLADGIDKLLCLLKQPFQRTSLVVASLKLREHSPTYAARANERNEQGPEVEMKYFVFAYLCFSVFAI